MQYELLLKGGEIIDAEQKLCGKLDIAFTDGKITALARDISASQAEQSIDVSGRLVTPGLIDLHVHVYAGVSTPGVEVDDTCPKAGTTTVVDAGSAGWAAFPGFRRYIIEKASTRVLSFVHISTIGLVDFSIGEMLDISYANPETTAKVVAENRDVVVGVKVRQNKAAVGENGFEPLRRAIRAAELADTRIMLHIGSMPGALPEALALLRSGDIVTHCFHGQATGGVLDENGKLLDEVRAAQRDGIIFDIGHGVGSFNFNVARAAIDAGSPPDVISTDLHTLSINGPVFDLPTTLSKFLYLGISLEDVIEKATSAPARIIGREELGTLKIGTPGDVAVFELVEGEFDFTDANGNRVIGNQKLMPVLTVKDGRIVCTRGGK